MTGIYLITNKINGKYYVGQSKDIYTRWKREKRIASNPNDKNYNDVIFRAIRKYGIENFSWTVLEECKIEELNQREIYWAKYYNSYRPNGYNVAKCGGGVVVHHKTTPEQISRIKNMLLTTNLTNKQIAEQEGLTVGTIQCINTGRLWKDDVNIYPIRSQNVYYNTCKKKKKEKEKKEPVKVETILDKYLQNHSLDEVFNNIYQNGFSKTACLIGYQWAYCLQRELKKKGYIYTIKKFKEWYEKEHNIIKETPKRKRVIQYDKEGNQIAIFSSTAEASTQLGFHHIKEICDGKRKTEHGYVFKYEEE